VVGPCYGLDLRRCYGGRSRFVCGYSPAKPAEHQLDIDWIKIDRAFVTDINTDTQSYQIVNALVKMSEALGIGLVAEGVETQAEREVLERLNVTRQQGYLFAKPMPFNKLLAFMVEKSHSPTVAV